MIKFEHPDLGVLFSSKRPRVSTGALWVYCRIYFAVIETG